METNHANEIILYQPDEALKLEDRIDRRLSEHDRHLLQLDEKVDFFVRSSLQP